MAEGNQDGVQQPASAPFLGARRAERYFEEWPTEIGSGGVAPTPPARARNVPHMGDSGQETADIVNVDEGAGESESVLRSVVALPAAQQAGEGTSRRHAPESSLVVTPERRRGFLGLFSTGPTRAQLAAQQLEARRTAIRLASWPRSVGVLVANPKGGVGKTPTALILGGVFASIRGGQTCVVEVTDDPGALWLRSEGPAAVGLAELVRDVAEIRGAGQLAGYTAQQTSYAAVVGTVGDRGALSHVDVQKVSDLLGFFYPIRVMDSGNQPSSSAFYGAISAADALVIPVLDAIDSVAGVQQLVRHMHRMGRRAAELAHDAIALRMDDGRPVASSVRAYVTDALADAGIPSISIPFDPHIATRSTISISELRPATVEAYTHAAAAVIARLN